MDARRRRREFEKNWKKLGLGRIAQPEADMEDPHGNDSCWHRLPRTRAVALILIAAPVVCMQAATWESVPKSDIALVAGQGWLSVPMAFSNGDGSFNVTNIANSGFAQSAQDPGVKVLTGDFNGDGNTDIALAGGQGWLSVIVAFSNGEGGFNVTNIANPGFAQSAQDPGVQILTGDFNGDGKTDIALAGGQGWLSIIVAFSNGDGSFKVTDIANPGFAQTAQDPGAKILVGDFNGDGKTDIALAGGQGWLSVPVAFSNGDGSFNATNIANPGFAETAQDPGAKILVGDFNGDGKTDIALAGGQGWLSVPVAFSNGDGSFNATNIANPGFAETAQDPGAKILAGDFNGDGKADIALSGGQGWLSVPVAFSNGDGSFNATNIASSGFAQTAQDPGVQILTGRFGAGPVTCTFSLSPSSQTFSAQGGSGSFAVNTGPTCAWTATSSAGWITVQPSGSTGAGLVEYAVAANNGANRTGTISAGGQNYSIDQQAFSCTFSIKPASATFNYTAGSANVSVTAPAGCAWTATSNAGWLSAASGASGTGDGTVVVNAASNAGGSRSGTMTIAGQTFSATQSPNACGAVDVSNEVSTSNSGFTLVPFTQFYYSSTLTVRSNSAQQIPGPVYLILDGLPTAAEGLLGSQLITHCNSSAGSYLIPLNNYQSLSPDQSTSVPEVFFNSIAFDPSYSTRVFSGTPSQ